MLAAADRFGEEPSELLYLSRGVPAVRITPPTTRSFYYTCMVEIYNRC
jgi:hypothetical protein